MKGAFKSSASVSGFKFIESKADGSSCLSEFISLLACFVDIVHPPGKQNPRYNFGGGGAVQREKARGSIV